MVRHRSRSRERGEESETGENCEPLARRVACIRPSGSPASVRWQPSNASTKRRNAPGTRVHGPPPHSATKPAARRKLSMGAPACRGTHAESLFTPACPLPCALQPLPDADQSGLCRSPTESATDMSCIGIDVGYDTAGASSPYSTTAPPLSTLLQALAAALAF